MNNASIGWALVFVAGCLEIVWPIGIKQAQEVTGSARWGWAAGTMFALVLSFALLTLAVSKRFGLPIGTAYAVWTGIGAAGAAAVGILLFHEPADRWRLLFLAMVILGVAGLKLTHRQAGPSPAAAERSSPPAAPPLPRD